jgi:hypothetical protein
MKFVVRKVMRRRIAIPERFAQNVRTRVIGFVEVFGVRTRPHVALSGFTPAVTDPTLFENSCTPGTSSQVRDTRCLSHAS